ncbi:transcription factor HES-4-A-like [Ornithodoros turicata]|uniref:Putative transcription factor hes-1 n=1 Tax=Ornithodoros turicata TaxID=34597 RepID=A0A2R5LKL5_9ACAR
MPADRVPSKASELRRSTKPIMEKRRRARINHSLTELKNLILDALKKDNARHSKLEKADILEMTVKHLQTLQRQQRARAIVSDVGVPDKFRAGFRECANEVGRYLSRVDGVDQTVRQRLLGHLTSCVGSLSSPPPSPIEDGNPRFFNGVPLLPTRLPTGEIAFLLPASQQAQLSVYTAPPSPPMNDLGSSGILSPAASDRSSIGSPSPVSFVQSPPPAMKVAPCAFVQPPQQMVKVEDEAVWRPW